MNVKLDKTASQAVALIVAAFVLVIIFASPLGAKAATVTAGPIYGNQIAIKVEEQPFYFKNESLVGGAGFFALVNLSIIYYIKKLDN